MHFANQPDPNITELKHIMLSVQTSVQNMEGKFSDLEKSMKEVKESNERPIESNNEVKEDVKDPTKRVESLKTELQASEDKRECLEAQSRRENLRLYGIPEDKDETWEETENKVIQYIDSSLEMNSANLSMERAHRIKSTDRPRPIIAKFSFYKEKEKVLKTYREKRKQSNAREKQCEGATGGSDDDRHGENDEFEENFRKDITACEDYPSRVMKARNNLRKFLKDALKDNKRAFLIYDKLIIEGDAYIYDQEAIDILLDGK